MSNIWNQILSTYTSRNTEQITIEENGEGRYLSQHCPLVALEESTYT